MVKKMTQPPQHAWEMVRTIRLPSLASETDAQTIRRALEVSPGVLETALDLPKRRLQVRYDVNQLNFRDLLDLLTQAGHPPPDGPLRRLLVALRVYADANARENAKAPPPPCCNKPPR